MNATETRYANLYKLTVKELIEIAKRMNLTYSGVKKADLVNKITEHIDGWHVIALDMNRAMGPVYKVGEVEFTGKTATFLIEHDKRIKRFNPTMARDKKGYVRLTPKQRRRVHKKDKAFFKSLGLYEAV
ncbi:MAG TPA: SAP domain-containing protein [Candidatus Paceibacterota bacterium]